jgi:hypothetical protein
LITNNSLHEYYLGLFFSIFTDGEKNVLTIMKKLVHHRVITGSVGTARPADFYWFFLV